MSSVFPILFFILREQSSLLILKAKTFPGLGNVFFNGAVLLFCTVVGATYPNVGSIMGILGAFSGLMMMYILPIVTYLKRRHLEYKSPEIVLALDENRLTNIHDKDMLMKSPQIGIIQAPSRRSFSTLDRHSLV